MFWSKALPIFIIILRSANAESGEGAPGTDEEAVFPAIKYLTHQNCTNITRQEMDMVLSYYPYVKVQCLAEHSTLIPTELQVSENLVNVKVPGALPDILPGIWGPRTYTFNEFVHVSESDKRRQGVPLAPCSGVTGSGTGNFELTVALRGSLQAMISGSRGLHFFESSIAFTSTFGQDIEVSHSVLCRFGQFRVRPVVEFTTIRTRHRIRRWVVEPKKTPFISREPWDDLERTKVFENTLVVACISEKHVPGVCSLDDAQMYDFLSMKNLLVPVPN